MELIMQPTFSTCGFRQIYAQQNIAAGSRKKHFLRLIKREILPNKLSVL